MERKPIIGVMGSGNNARAEDVVAALELGKLIAREGWVLLSGGRNVGVMESVNKGAKSAGGLTIGIIAGADMSAVSEFVDIPVITAMGSARNNINVLSSDVIIACGIGGAGTASEISLALKNKKPTILLNENKEAEAYFKKLGGELVHSADSAKQAIDITRKLLNS